jgi:hypothetical protein
MQTSEKIKAQVGKPSLTWAFMLERVTGIEPAPPAWESSASRLSEALTSGSTYPRVTLIDLCSPWLMAR